MVTMTVFLGILGLVVGMMIYGMRMFGQAALRQGIEGDARRLSTRLRQDLALTDFRTVGHQERTVGGHRRDGLAVAALSDWNDTANFEPGIGLPLWNQFRVYYATRETQGKLIRQVVAPPGVPSSGWTAPYGALSSNLDDDPTLNSDVLSSAVLTDMVESFRVQPDMSENTVTVFCRLRRSGGLKAGTQERSDETMEFRLLLKARNTWPDV